VRTKSVARIRTARVIAVCADLVQIGFPYIFGEGFFSPFENVLDAAVCVAMTLLVGWHFAFLPSFVVKLVPVLDLAPTWTIAVFIATRRSKDTRTDGNHAMQIKDANVLKDETVDASNIRNKD
jgi:hypothetical protein